MNLRSSKFPMVSALLALCLTASLSASELAVYFGPTKKGDPNGLDTQTVKLIKSAKTRLNAAVHEVRLQSIADAFIAAHKRGVKVRMVGEDKYYENDFMKQIRAAGIPTRSDENPNAIMHNKFVVADGERMLTGSYNLTDTCSYNNYNNLVVVSDKAMCKIFDEEFEKLFAGHIYDESDSEFHTVNLKLNDREVPVDIFFQPRNRGSEEKVLELLGSAQQGIYVMQFAFFNGGVGKLLAEKFRDKKDVQAVIDYSMVFGDFEPYHQIGRLVEAGIPFCIGDDLNGKLHHKVFTVDPDTDKGMVLTGSANSSGAGFNKNAENIIVIHDRKIAERFKAEALKLIHRTDAGIVTVKPRGLTGMSREHQFDIMVDSGGKPLKEIELSLPFHWRVGSVRDVSVWKGDRAPSSASVSLETRVPSRYTTIPVQMIVLKDANLTPSGPTSKVTVRVRSMKLDPETLPGKYCIYSRGTDGSGPRVALASMPLIYLFRTAAENVGYMAKLLESQEVRASTELKFLCRDLDSSLGDQIEKGDMSAMKDFVFLVEKAAEGNNPRLNIMKSLIGGLVQKLNFAAQAGGPGATEAKALAARLRALK